MALETKRVSSIFGLFLGKLRGLKFALVALDALAPSDSFTELPGRDLLLERERVANPTANHRNHQPYARTGEAAPG